MENYRGKPRCPSCSSFNLGFERQSGYAGYRCLNCRGWRHARECEAKIAQVTIVWDLEAGTEAMYVNEQYRCESIGKERISPQQLAGHMPCNAPSYYIETIIRHPTEGHHRWPERLADIEPVDIDMLIEQGKQT